MSIINWRDFIPKENGNLKLMTVDHKGRSPERRLKLAAVLQSSPYRCLLVSAQWRKCVQLQREGTCVYSPYFEWKIEEGSVLDYSLSFLKVGRPADWLLYVNPTACEVWPLALIQLVTHRKGTNGRHLLDTRIVFWPPNALTVAVNTPSSSLQYCTVWPAHSVNTPSSSLQYRTVWPAHSVNTPSSSLQYCTVWPAHSVNTPSSSLQYCTVWPAHFLPYEGHTLQTGCVDWCNLRM